MTAGKPNGKKAAKATEEDSEDDESWAYGAVGDSDSEVEEMVTSYLFQLSFEKRRVLDAQFLTWTHEMIIG